eukprot:gnl/MRDRNA2_/MRDRNA2_29147_c0_seq1.p1 gnl/MRDRNA2_/MRDRNA2_29147_c0~~gnl/MRDRNA2_/MRDRNA2_29147_c0_seq1.p1  ORF type:complete len:1311 (-),score=279.25 gnl/MRDRNA2_/MRDRNA2_29147_c0_seq1:370-4302(-)
MKLTVKVLVTGKVMELDLPQDSTVLDTKKRIESLEGNTVPSQRLIFGGKTLRDGQTLQDCGIQKEAVVHLVLRLQNSLTISIRTMTGKTITLEVKLSDTVDAVKAMIEEIAQIPSNKHSLNFAGHRLAKNLTMSDCGIMDKATLRLILEPLAETAPLPSVPNKQSSGMLKTFFEIARSWSSGADTSSCSGMDSVSMQLKASEEQDRIRVYGDLGTLYARCGGIFGISAFVDRCMDKWMADAMLNANPAVATWHGKAQRCGFKFLVTQLMGYLTGGPQVYTGRSMAESHKHLNISPLEWGNFMEIFRDVCREFALPESDTEDLAAILLSMEEDCVVHTGEEVPQKPGLALLEGESLYARLGGVYPIALFTDRLVDALLTDKRVKIPVDGQKRNEASLKYLFTEVVCHAAGGPEVITSTVCKETRLLLSGRKIFYFLNAAKDASDHFGFSALQSELVACMYSIQNLIVDPQREVRLSAKMEDRRQKITALGQKTGVQLLYIPGGGVVKLDFDASAKQLQDVSVGLAELGLKTVEKTKVKTADEAAAGNMLSSATIAARYAAPGSFVAARKRVHGDPRTLYGRGGGVFGLAKLADRLMDVWMSDPTLNANDMVARWHQSQQKFGFKFLVTQIFGYLTGGPQRYTGQPMDVAHKHLGITLAQWDSFMAGADRVFREFKVDQATQQDLRGILASLRDQIIVTDGAAVPPDPDLCRKPPAGNSLYAQAGGVYPLAQFVDALVDLALASSDIGIPHDQTFKRTPPGLKYLVTELVCSSAGGPEIVTSRGFDDAKLAVPVDSWGPFLDLVKDAAATVWQSRVIQSSIVAMLDEQKAELCVGLVSQDTSPGAAARSKLREAGFGLIETTAALNQCNGDAEEALTLLISGWTPQHDVMAMNSSGEKRQCPFSGSSTGGGGCPFLAGSGYGSGSSTEVLPTPQGKRAKNETSLTRDRVAGRVLGSSLQEELDNLLHEDPDICCPVTLVLFLDPVIATDGCIYEKSAITELTRIGGLSPVTHKPLGQELFPAQEQKAQAAKFMAERTLHLLRFARRAQSEGQIAMALTALDRVKDYVGSLTPQRVPGLVEDLTELCTQLSVPLPALASPHDRIDRILEYQVKQAKDETGSLSKNDDSSTKSVVFTVDVSGSMRGARIERARNNLLKIFDEYIEDEDQLSMITFDNTTTEIFPLQEVGMNRDRLRREASDACQVRGGTAFYDALIESSKSFKDGLAESQQWIIAITDGADQHSRNTLEQALAKVQASPGKPNLIIVGIELQSSIKPRMEKLTTVTETSVFIDASGGLQSLDEAFQQVAELICE